MGWSSFSAWRGAGRMLLGSHLRGIAPPLAAGVLGGACGHPAEHLRGVASRGPDAQGARDAGCEPCPPALGPRGGTLAHLTFAVVGDTRPPVEDDTADYPVAVIDGIYDRIEALAPQPAFVVATGDYLFASPRGREGAPQLDLYLAARRRYSGAFFPAMGNHECTGFTVSNCGPGTAEGVTENYSAFLAKLLGPIHQPDPYYEIDVDSTERSWTAKFLFVAANAWSSAQAAWLERALERTTTYTFVVRHEPARAVTAPGVLPSESILARHPYTLVIVGHTHTYERSGPRELLVGNGGAPLDRPVPFGFARIDRRDDGAIAVDMIDAASGRLDPAFRFALWPDGSPAP